MSPIRHRLARAAALLVAHLAQPAMADTFISFAASDSVALSLGTSSASFGRSSDASSHHRRHDLRQVNGDYKVIGMVAAEGRPGITRLTLQAAAADGVEDRELHLDLPQAVVARNALAVGQMLQAQQRPYGVAFAQGEPRRAFFLVIDDARQGDLLTQPVTM